MDDSQYDSQHSTAKVDCIELSPSIPQLRKQAFEQRILSPLGMLLTLLLCVSTLLFSHFTFVLNVKVDGEVIGSLPDTEVLETLIDTTEDAVGHLLGRPAAVAERVSYTLTLTSVSEAERLDPQVVELGLFHHIDGVDMHYVLTIDGEPMGYVADLEELQTAMDQRLEGLMAEGLVSAAFVSEMAYDTLLVGLDNSSILYDLRAFVETLAVETVEEVTYTETIPFEIEVIFDDERFLDSVEILQAGSDGEMEIVVLVTYIDGEPIDYTILQTKILAEAVPEIIIEGTQVRPLTASWGYYIWPTVGTVSSTFGPRQVRIGSSNHQGIDISAPAGTPVIAADGGEVIFTGWSGGFGNLIKIRHDNDHVTYYAHLSSIDIQTGERVYRGQFIGRVGMTGTASGNHLHFEIRIDGIPVDPLPLLP